jgi:hypothetical protein
MRGDCSDLGQRQLAVGYECGNEFEAYLKCGKRLD